jgi:hypothetical protein
MSGTDNKENIIKLTAREHFLCHILLAKANKHTKYFYKLVRASIMMGCQSDVHERYINSRLYETMKIQFANNRRSEMTGTGNTMYGKRWCYNVETGATCLIHHTDDVPVGYTSGRHEKTKSQSVSQLTVYYDNLKHTTIALATIRIFEFIDSPHKSINEFCKDKPYSQPSLSQLLNKHPVYKTLSNSRKKIDKKILLDEMSRWKLDYENK